MRTACPLPMFLGARTTLAPAACATSTVRSLLPSSNTTTSSACRRARRTTLPIACSSLKHGMPTTTWGLVATDTRPPMVTFVMGRSADRPIAHKPIAKLFPPRRVAPPMRRTSLTLLLVVLVAFVAVEAWTLRAGASFVAADEAGAYLLDQGLLAEGHPVARVPFAQWAASAFSPLTFSRADYTTPIPISPVFIALTAPLTLLGFPAILAAMILASAALVVGAWLLADELWGGHAGAIAAALLAFSPPLLFFGSLYFANVPALALFAWGTWCVLRQRREKSAAWTWIGVLLLLGAVAMRRDGILLAIPGLVVAALLARDDRRLRAPLALGALGAALSFVLANADPEVTLLGSFTPRGLALLWQDLRIAYLQTHPEGWSWDALTHNAAAFLWGASPALVALGAVGFFLARPAGRIERACHAALLATAALYLAFYLTWDLRGSFDPPGLFSSLVRYTMIVPLVAALAAAGF